MDMTVKQLKDMIEEMRTVYPFEDDKTHISTYNVRRFNQNEVNLFTKDKRTGVVIKMEKSVPFDKDGEE